MTATELLEAPQSKGVVKDQLNLSSQSLDLFKEGRSDFASKDKTQSQAILKDFGDLQINMNDHTLLINKTPDTKVDGVGIVVKAEGSQLETKNEAVKIPGTGCTDLGGGNILNTDNGQLVSLTSPDGKQTTYKYSKDAQGHQNLSEIHNPDGSMCYYDNKKQAWRFSPASDHGKRDDTYNQYLADFKVNNDGTYSYAYGAGDDKTTVAHKADNSEVYTRHGDVEAICYSNGSASWFKYDANHNITEVRETDGKGGATVYTPGSSPDKPWLVNGKETDGINPPSGFAPHVDADGTYHWKGGNGKDYVRTTNGTISDHDPKPPLHRNSHGTIDNIGYPQDIKTGENGELTGFTVNNEAFTKINGKWVDSQGRESKDFSAASINPANGDVNLTLPSGNTQIIIPNGDSYIGTREENGNLTIRNAKGQLTEIDMPDGHFRQISYKADGSLNEIDLEDGKKLTFDVNNVPSLDGVRVAGAKFDEQSRTVTVTNLDGTVSTYGPDSHLISTTGTAGAKT